MSFCFRIDHVRPDFNQQLTQNFTDGGWKPPTWGIGLRTTEHGRLYRWRSGAASIVSQNDLAYVRIAQIPGQYQYKAATVFTQVPSSQSFLGVEFDARYSNIDPDYRWEKLMFTHAHRPAGQGYYSELGIQREYYQMATGTNSNWQQDLFPQQMHCPANTQNAANRHNAGLTGSLPLLLAVIAFSGPQQQLANILQNCLRQHPTTSRGMWVRIQGLAPGCRSPRFIQNLVLANLIIHQGTQHRGVVVTVFKDPTAPQTNQWFRELERGTHNAFLV